MNACASRPVITPLACSSLGSRGAEARLRRPAADAEIAHAARPVLEIGLEQEDRVAEAAVARPLLGAQPRHEVLGRRLGHARAEFRQKLAPQRLVAGQKARVEQRGRRRQIALGQRQRLLERADGVPGVDLGVPERIEDRLRQRLHRRVRVASRTAPAGRDRRTGASSARPKPPVANMATGVGHFATSAPAASTTIRSTSLESARATSMPLPPGPHGGGRAARAPPRMPARCPTSWGRHTTRSVRTH